MRPLRVGAVGPSVRNPKVGDSVLVPFNIFCGSCYFCQKEFYSNCHNVNPEATAVGGIYPMEFIKDHFRHCKTILALGAARRILDAAGIKLILPTGEPDPGILATDSGAAAAKGFMQALAKHRHVQRDQDPPEV